MDMIPFGQLQLMSPAGKGNGASDKNAVALAGRGATRWCQLSRPQMETFITLRALAASPLMVGGDLPTMDDYSLSLLTNPDMIACNQNSVMGRLVGEADRVETWLVEERGTADKGWIGVFNRNAQSKELVLKATQLGLKKNSPYRLRDIWHPRNIELPSSNPAGVTLPPHGALFLRFERSK